MVHVFDDNEDVIELKNVFFYLDYLNNGRITKKELRTFFLEYGEIISDKEIDEIILSLKLRTKGSITYTEFIAGTISPAFFQDDDNLRCIFKRFDLNDDKHISAENLQNCFNRFGIFFRFDQIEEMLQEIGVSKTNLLTEDKFRLLMNEIGKIREPEKPMPLAKERKNHLKT